MVELLSDNKIFAAEKKEIRLKQAFLSAGQIFTVIDDKGLKNILVPYREGKGLIQALQSEADPEQKRIILRKLQRYSAVSYTHLDVYKRQVFSYTRQFDHCEISAENLLVTREEIEEAFESVGSEFLEVMKRSAENIRRFHEKQLRSSWFDPRPDGTILGMKHLPIATAGVYRCV